MVAPEISSRSRRSVGFLLFVYFVCGLLNLNAAHKLISDRPPYCPVFLTLAVLSKNAADSNIEINWGPNCQRPPHWIGVYRSDPSLNDNPAETYVETRGSAAGKFKTNIKLGALTLPYGWNHEDFSNDTQMTNWDGTTCLPFYVAGFERNELKSINCLKIHPNWMNRQEHLWDMQLKDLFIPGTHCSACYTNKFTGRSMLSRKFGYSQNFDVWTQLVLGIRYLDISVGYQGHNGPHNETKHLWVVNDSLFIIPLIHVLQDIRKFIRVSGEAVIMDIRHFPTGFYNHPHRHIELINLIESQLGDVIFRKNMTNIEASYNLTMNMMKNEGKMLLVTYNEPKIEPDHNLIWPSWKHLSTINTKLDEVRDCMSKAFTGKYEGGNGSVGWTFAGIQGIDSSFSSSQTILTSRERAATINRNVSTWIGGPWSLAANVVTLDFVCNTNLIDIALYTNSNKKLFSNNLINFDVQK